MKVVIVYYNTCALFEVTVAAFFLSQKAEVVTAGPELTDYKSLEGMNVRPDVRLRDVDWSGVDMLIVPGGHAENLLECQDMSDAVRAMDRLGRPIAAICGGPTHLAKAGVLKGRRFTTTVYEARKELFEGGVYMDQDLVIDGNIITAWPNAYVDFAFALADRMGIFKDAAEREETVRQFKQFQRG